jgi:ankyrin repeat protein
MLNKKAKLIFLIILISAFYNNQTEMIKLLVEAGAKFNTTEKTDER